MSLIAFQLTQNSNRTILTSPGLFAKFPKTLDSLRTEHELIYELTLKKNLPVDTPSLLNDMDDLLLPIFYSLLKG